jgi:6-phosphogluconolactonase
MQLTVAHNLNELSKKAAEWIIQYITDVVKKKNQFTFVLSGGSTPGKLYQLLSSPAYSNQIDWKKIHFFWGDERFVPFSDHRNNAKMAFENLLNAVPVEKNNIHMIRTDIDPEDAAAEYEELLHQYFPDVNHSFDLVLLGMGDNAHTLSLFPGYDIIHEKEKWVISFYLREQKMYRITLTPGIVNAARRILFLISGAEKAAALYHVLSEEIIPDLYPAQLIQPYTGKVYGFIDEAAAADLKV